MDSQPSFAFANCVPYRPATNLVPPPSEHHSDHQQHFSRSARSFSETQALNPTSENNIAIIQSVGGNGHWDPLMLQYVFAVSIILPQLFKMTFPVCRGIFLLKQQTCLRAVTDLM